MKTPLEAMISVKVATENSSEDMVPGTDLVNTDRVTLVLHADATLAVVSTQPPSLPWQEFGTAFGTIFLAELGDKTQLATLLMVAQSGSPWVVFIGAATALVATSLVGVLVGRWLAARLSPRTLQTATGASLLLIAVLLLWDVVHL